MSHPGHPVWRLLTTLVYLAFACFFMWLNASSFDKTEMKTLVELAVVMLSVEGVKDRLKKGAESDA